jgi:hypothetical protein
MYVLYKTDCKIIQRISPTATRKSQQMFVGMMSKVGATHFFRGPTTDATDATENLSHVGGHIWIQRWASGRKGGTVSTETATE